MTIDIPIKSGNFEIKTFTYGVIIIGIAGASYAIEPSYISANISTVSRQVTGELRVTLAVGSTGSLKGIPQVNAVRGLSATTPFIWKIRTLNNGGELLMSAYDNDTGAEVDVNSFIDTQLVSFTLETIGGL